MLSFSFILAKSSDFDFTALGVTTNFEVFHILVIKRGHVNVLVSVERSVIARIILRGGFMLFQRGMNGIDFFLSFLNERCQFLFRRRLILTGAALPVFLMRGFPSFLPSA